MAVVFGVTPKTRGGVALGALYCASRLPASLITCTSVPSVDAALNTIVGVVGEWGELSAVAVAAPLTWSGAPNGARGVDKLLRKRLPPWAPRTWQRAPLAWPTRVAVQGPALTWGLASEIRNCQLPQHAVVECNPRLTMALLWPDQRGVVLGCMAAKTTAGEPHLSTLVDYLVNAGTLQLEGPRPRCADELEAVVAALTALGTAMPESGLVVHDHLGGDIRPVGKRAVALLEALP